MFGFGTAGKTRPDPGKVVGLDLTATRLSAVVSAAGRQRPLALDTRGNELPLMLHLGSRTPAVGGAAAAVARKSPHLVCSGFLPQLGQPTLWQSGRTRVTPEEALTAVFAAACPAVAGESDAAELALPSYLTAAQVRGVGECVAKAKLPVRGTSVAALAVVAHRAEQLTGSFPCPAGQTVPSPSSSLTRTTTPSLRVSWPSSRTRSSSRRLASGRGGRCGSGRNG
jgi:hypothetical protein